MENGRYKILYFEDDEVLAQMLKIKLEQAGFLFKHYENTTTDPVSLVIREKPDLIIMDIIMPIMDGFEATQRLKQNHATKHIPIFGFDNLSQPADIKKAYDLDMVDYWVKASHTPGEVVDKVKMLLGLPVSDKKPIPSPGQAGMGHPLLGSSIRSKPVRRSWWRRIF